jgi:hypothetical protein
VRDHWQIWFSLGTLPCFFLHVLNAIW